MKFALLLKKSAPIKVALFVSALILLSFSALSAQKNAPPKTVKPPSKITPKISLTAAETVLEKGKKFLAEDLYAEAIIEFNQAIRLDPKLAEAFLQRAIAHGQRGNIEISRQDALQAIRLSPNLARAYNVLGKTYEQEKQYDVAISNYGKAIELEPKYVAAYNNRGFAYTAIKMFNEAIRDFTEAIRLDIKNAYAYYENRGIAYGLKEDYAKAIDDFTNTIKIKPQRANAYKLRAFAYRKIGKTDAAEIDENVARDLESENN